MWPLIHVAPFRLDPLSPERVILCVMPWLLVLGGDVIRCPHTKFWYEFLTQKKFTLLMMIVAYSEWWTTVMQFLFTNFCANIVEWAGILTVSRYPCPMCNLSGCFHHIPYFSDHFPEKCDLNSTCILYAKGKYCISGTIRRTFSRKMWPKFNLHLICQG